MRFLLAFLLAMIFASEASARQGFSAAAGVMAMTNSTKQGGQGTAGSTILTQTDMTYHDDWWGGGLYFQYDKQGSNEVDTAFGPRLELTMDPFYIEMDYAAIMHRSFTDRSIAEQTGNGYTLGLGSRFGIGGGGAFLQFSYKYRIQQVTKQDGAKLDEAITQTDGYPLFGIGFGF